MQRLSLIPNKYVLFFFFFPSLTLYGQLCFFIFTIIDNCAGGDDVSSAWDKANLGIMATKTSDEWTPVVEVKLTLSLLSEVDSFGDTRETLVARTPRQYPDLCLSVYPLSSSKDCFLACNYTEQ